MTTTLTRGGPRSELRPEPVTAPCHPHAFRSPHRASLSRLGLGRPRPQDHLRDRPAGTQRQSTDRSQQIARAGCDLQILHGCLYVARSSPQAGRGTLHQRGSLGHTITTATCLTAPKCLFTGIAVDLELLRTSHDDQAKLASLKFLGHWVGDIHQPLHVSFADDRGGNFIRESEPCVNSLHTVWDVCIIEHGTYGQYTPKRPRPCTGPRSKASRRSG